MRTSLVRCLALAFLHFPAAAQGAGKWADEDEVVVVQRQPYERDGRWPVTVYAGLVPNDPFVVYLPVGLRVGRFFNESLLSEISVSYLDALAGYRELRDEVTSSVQLEDHQVARAQWTAAWTLLAAKGHWYEERVYVRGHLLGGFGAVLARDATSRLDPRAEGVFGVGFEVHLTGATSLRVDVRQSIFARQAGGTLLPTEISLGWLLYPGGPLGGRR